VETFVDFIILNYYFNYLYLLVIFMTFDLMVEGFGPAEVY